MSDGEHSHEESRGGRTPPLYRWLDHLSGGLLLFVVVFAPWAFGCTVSWAIWTVCGVGYGIGVCLIGKWVIRWRTGFEPSTWHGDEGRSWPMISLAVLTLLFLAYVLISAVNYRAAADLSGPEVELSYRESIPWLPHSFDAPRTWRAFWRYLALAFLFWGARDWLMGKNRRERLRRTSDDDDEEALPAPVPTRLKTLLWVLCASSAVLAVISLLQRLDGTNKLLWTLTTRPDAEAQFSFGPYSYRANGAQYFNLVWPVCLGFWRLLAADDRRVRGRTIRAGSQARTMLVPCGALMASAPVVTASRGGVIIFALAAVAAATVLVMSARDKFRWFVGAAGFLGVSLGLALWLGGEHLRQRFETVFTDKFSGRPKIYEVARRIAQDYPVFGTGAETLTAVYPLYRASESDTREGYVHNDWLETWVTCGAIGLGILVLSLGAVLVNWWMGKGAALSGEFSAFLGIGLGTLLTHAWIDFPFQIFSLLTIFLVLASVAASVRKA